MAIGAVLAPLMMAGGLSMMIPPVMRTLSYGLNYAEPNLAPDPATCISAKLRGDMDDKTFHLIMRIQGIREETADNLFKLTKRLLDGVELINLERRGEITPEIRDERSAKQGWQPEQIAELYKLTEIIPSAGDIIRYAVREVYSPEISEPFGQFDGLPEVLELARADLKAAGLPETTFTKEWAAHWLLPSIMQGFEMLHRGVIPARSTEARPLGLDRLMKALDIMPAWQEPLTAISYSPYTRVDVRRMHKIGVLDDEAVFTAYADVGFSPFAPGETHDTVAEAFACEKCRHDSKVGHMLDFTILYNKEPPEIEKVEKDIQRDRTKSDILSGLADGLVDEGEATSLLSGMGYDAEEVAYYLSRVTFEQASDELTTSLRYLHDSYIKGVMTFNQVTDEMGKLNLPATMTEHYMRVWDLERIARSNKPTKSELMTFLRKDIIDEKTWHAEMIGLGYPDRYIEWYHATVEKEPAVA